MKRFAKNNMVLLIVLGVTLIVVLGLMVFAVMEHTRMYSNFSQAENLSKQISELIKQNPAPVAGNVEPIQSEIAMYKEKTEKLRARFGNLEKPALLAFAKTLGVKLPELQAAFRTAWESDASRNALGGRYRFYNRFKKEYPKWDEARDVFRQEYQKVTPEPLTPANLDEVLLSALGLQRSMDGDPQKCMRFMWTMRSHMIDVFTENGEKNEKGDKRATSIIGEAGSFGFDYKTLPLPENIPNIVRNWKVIGDLATRLSKAGLDSLNSFKIRNLAGERVGDYIIYHYTVGVTGDINQIRAFVKSLNDAYAENRIYVVRSVFLYADSDGAQNVFRERAAEAERLRLELESGSFGGANPADGGGDNRRNRRDARRAAPDMPPDMPGARPEDQQQQQQPTKTAAQLREELLKMPYDKRPGYGKIVFGGSKKCEAVLDIEYISLATPELN
ncbi:MAG: hypothetical protein AB7F32_02665 [Victivallaceae bacterium]